MKTSKWILGIIYALCFSILLAMLGTCNLNDKSFYRWAVTGNGSPISIACGWCDYGNNSVKVYDSRSYGGTGWWQTTIDEDDAKAGPGPAIYIVASGSQGVSITTRITHHTKDQDGKSKDDVVAENTALGFYRSVWALQSPQGGGGGGGTPGPGIPPTEVCAELYRQGLMPEDIFHADQLFGAYLREYQNEVLIGYKFLDRPVVSLMRKSKTFTLIVNVVAKPWTYEMAYRMGARDEGSFVGKIVMDAGVPVYRTVGRAVTWAREHRYL